MRAGGRAITHLGAFHAGTSPAGGKLWHRGPRSPPARPLPRARGARITENGYFIPDCDHAAFDDRGISAAPARVQLVAHALELAP